MMEQKKSEVTFKDIVFFLKELKDNLLKRWVFIVVVGLVGAVVLGFWAYTQPKVYAARLTFVVKEEDNSSNLGQLPSVLSSFGISGGSDSGLNLDKIVALSKSEKIIFAALLSHIDSTSQDVLADVIIREYDLYNGQLSEGFKNMSFQDASSEHKSTLRLLKNYIVEPTNEFLSVNYDQNSQIMDISVQSIDEDIALGLARELYKHLEDFYVLQSINQAQETVRGLKLRLDSIKNKLDVTEHGLARTIDKGAGLLYSKDQVKQYKLQRDLEIENTAYVEILKNYEIAKYKLQSITPFFTVIDAPFYPLPSENYSFFRYAMLGFILSVFILILLYSFNMVWKKFVVF